jgi:YD repeat-containing protein
MTRLLSRVLAAVLSIGRTVERWSRNAPLRRAAVFLAVTCVPISMAWSATQYLYDDLGRLVLVVNPQGSIVYQYDANGNVTTITKSASNALAVTSFSPPSGRAGEPVSISGNGFSVQLAENQVTIGGVTAPVNAATSSSISTTIPYGASTGPISVTVNGVTATSSQDLVVRVPGITSFAPTLVNPGANVTLDGNDLNLVSGGTSIAVGGGAAAVSSLTNTQTVFAAPNSGGGPIVVTTSYGQATSATELHIVPSAINAANVVADAVATPNGASQSISINAANKYGLLEFQGTSGQYVSVQVSSVSTTPGSASVYYQIFSPSNTQIASGSVSSNWPQHPFAGPAGHGPVPPVFLFWQQQFRADLGAGRSKYLARNQWCVVIRQYGLAG